MRRRQLCSALVAAGSFAVALSAFFYCVPGQVSADGWDEVRAFVDAVPVPTAAATATPVATATPASTATPAPTSTPQPTATPQPTPNWGSVAITGGTINGATIGATTPAAGKFTGLTSPALAPQTPASHSDGTVLALTGGAAASGIGFPNHNGGNLTLAGGAAVGAGTAGSVFLSSNWTASGRTCANLGTVTTADIDGGTIDGVTLGGTSAGAGKFSTLTLPSGTSIPGTCSVPAIFFDTDSDDCVNTGGGSGTLCLCTATNTWTEVGSGAGGSMPVKVITYTAGAFDALEHAADSIAPVSFEGGTNVDQFVRLFDAGTDECVGGRFAVPAEITAGGTVTFRVYFYAAVAATSCTGDADLCSVYWDIKTYPLNGAETWDAALVTDSGNGNASQTQDTVTELTFTETVSNLGWVADDMVQFEFCRDANNANDDLAGDAALISLSIEIPRS